MGWQKIQAVRCSRIIASRAPQPSLYYSDANTRGHGLMASLFGRTKYLTCFYCNTKSDLPHDGLISQWECRTCEAMNYLDENGDITDPPVASSSYEPAPVDLKYSIHRPESPPHSQPSDSTTFCSTCLKNQHLLTTSLAQYEIELDVYNPKYKQNEKQYYKYRKGLEQRYPQVCEDCAPKAIERLKQAAYAAKTDNLRRTLEKSRKKRPTSRRNGSLLSIDSVGKSLWYFGLLSQLLWHILALFAAIPHEHRGLFAHSVPKSLLTPYWTIAGYSNVFPVSILCSVFSNSLGSFSTSRLAKWSLISSVISFYWNPRFRELEVGFINHIQGYSDWYKYQLLLLVIRALFYIVMGTGVLADPNSSATVTAHTFVLGFITYLAVVANFSLKVDMKPFWESTPEKFEVIGPRTSPGSTGDAMTAALNEIAGTPSRGRPNVARQSPPLFNYLENSPKNSNRQQYDAPKNTFGYQRELPKHTPVPLYETQNRSGKKSALQDHRRSFEEKLLSLDINKPAPSLQPRLRPSPPPAQAQAQDERQQEAMDWSPSYSQYRAFAAPVERSKPAFSSAPIEPRESPFWYKVPPAPISAAHRLRNPPNQPRLRVSSQEVKDNFFNSVTRKRPTLGQSQEKAVSRHEVEFAQPRFFPPTPPSEADNIADMFHSISLSDDASTKAELKSKKGHVVRAFILLFGLIYWNQEVYYPSAQMTNILLGILTGCLCLSIRSVVDIATLRLEEKKRHLWSGFGLWLSFLESVVAICGLVEVWSRTGKCSDCASLGTIYIGEMMVRELWQALF